MNDAFPPSGDVAPATRWYDVTRSSVIGSDGRLIRASSRDAAVARFRHNSVNWLGLTFSVPCGGAGHLLGCTCRSDRPCLAYCRCTVTGPASDEEYG
jgi:hypothetical protein